MQIVIKPIITAITVLLVLISFDLSGQLPPFTECQDDGDAFVGLDRKAWTTNVNEVSASYQLNFEIPDPPPYDCAVIDKVTFTINGFSGDNSGGCISMLWTHVLDCDSNDPIDCPTDPFSCCNVDAAGLNNWTIDNDDDDLSNGQTLGFDIVAISELWNGCPQDIISAGLYSASFDVCMEVFYVTDTPDDFVELDDGPTICAGETIELEGPSGFNNYIWEGPVESNDRTLDDAIPGIYTLIVTDDKGCTSSDEIEILVHDEFVVSFDQPDPYILCSQGNEQLQALIDNSIEARDYDYFWTAPGATNSTNDNINIDVSGIYTVEATNEDTDCIVTESIEVILTQLSIAQIDSISEDVINTCDPFVNIEAFIPSIDNTPYSYQWVNGIDTVRTQTFEVSESGTYILNLLNQLGCPTTSDTIEVNITPPSVAGLDNQTEECNNQTFDLNVYLSGDASTNGIWENISGRGSLVGNEFDPMSDVGLFNFNYIVMNPSPCENDTSEITLTINESSITNIDDVLCDDDFRIVNGVTYDQTSPFGEENMININGCDSTIFIDLSFITESTFLLDDELCADDFRIVDNVTYDINNPSGEETISNVNGCDSVVTIDLTFVTQINSDLIEELCTDDFREVNGTIYNNTNTSGSETLVSVSGCDSIVNIDLTFIDEINVTFDPELCPDEFRIINNNRYDDSNPIGTETFQSVSGCDSIVNINISFSTPIITPLGLSLCPDDFREVNGTIYDESNNTGTEIFPGSNGCDSTVVIDLIYFPASPETSQTLFFCDSIFVIDEWIYQAGLVVDILSDINGCDSIINTMVELDNCIKSVRTTFTDLSCFGDDDGTITIEVTGEYDYPLDYTIELNSNPITQSQILEEGIVEVNMLASGIYTIELIDVNSNSIYSETVNILSPDELQVILTEEVAIDCNGNTNGQISSMVTGSSGTIDYLWSDMSTGSELMGIGAGIYSVTVQDDNNCSAENSITIEEPEALTATITGNNIVCNSNDGGSIEVSDINGGVAPYLTSIDGNIYEDIPVYDNLQADTYMVSIKDANDCIYEESITIISESTFTITPIDTIRIEEGSSATIDLNLDFAPVSINWSPGTDLSCNDCEITEASPMTDISYTVTVEDALGCEIVTEVYVKVSPMEIITEPIDIYFPNTFSVNLNDGINDVFKPLTSSGVDLSITSIVIFDRWGNIVHEEIGQVEGWNGFINNTAAEKGVYLYKMNYTVDGNENIAIGNITLIN